MPTSARWEAANLPRITGKSVHPAGGQSRPPLQRAGCRKRFVGADDSVGPLGRCESAEEFRIKQCILPGRCGHRPLHWCVRIRIGLSLFATVCRNLSVSFADSSPERGAFGVCKFWDCSAFRESIIAYPTSKKQSFSQQHRMTGQPARPERQDRTCMAAHTPQQARLRSTCSKPKPDCRLW